MAATMLQFPTQQAETAAAHVDAILRTNTQGITYQGELRILAEGAKQIRDLFRSLGWSKYFRVTKGCWTLGPSIEWAKEYKPTWDCADITARKLARNTSPRWFDIPCCGCATCKHREAQRRAIARRVSYVLNAAFHKPGERKVGDHSDSMTDYFDADYTFHA